MTVNYLQDIPTLRDDILTNLTTRELSQKYNICERTIRKLRTRLKDVVKPNQPLIDGIPEDQVNFTDTGNKRDYVIITHKQVKTLQELIELLQLDSIVWEVEKWGVKCYEGFFKNKTVQHAQIVQMFSVNATVRPVKGGQLARNEIESIKQELKTRAIAAPVLYQPTTFKPSKPSELMLLISPSDMHFGKLAWSKETGYDDFDLEIAEDIFNRAIDNLIDRNSHLQFDRVQIVIGNDLVNADSKANLTTGGTPQDCDSRYQKIYLVAKKCVRRAIDIARSISPQVDARFTPGNHDGLTVWTLGDSIDSLYESTPGVKIFNSPRLHSYDRHGVTGFMFHHGNDIKRADFPIIFASECPKVFSECAFKEIILGHLHKNWDTVDEAHGFKIRTSPSPTATDAWHASKGYVGNLRSVVARTYSKPDGYLGEQMFTLLPSKQRLEEDAGLVY